MTDRPEVLYAVTLYPSLYERGGIPKTWSWPQLVELFGEFTIAASKDAVPGFGPYALTDRPCGRPEHPSVPHRCDALVDAVTLAVFDVDMGEDDAVAECSRRLMRDGTAHLFYSTHSYRPDAPVPSLRLVVPLLRPVPAHQWRSFRQAFLRTFAVPADIAKCGGLSHFYYAPSHPPGVEPLFDSVEGRPFDPSRLPVTGRAPLVTTYAVPSFDESPDPEALALHREALTLKARRLSTSPKDESRTRAAVLEAVVAGRPLAEHGSRNATTTRAAFDLVRLLPSATASDVLALLAPSTKAMRDEGSSLTLETVRRMVASAHAKVEAARARESELEAYLTRHLTRTDRGTR